MNNPPTDSDKRNEVLKITSSHILIVEGKDEVNFFEALLREMNNSLDIQIMDIGGKGKIHNNLQALTNSPGFSNVISIGIIRDADTDPQAAFQSVCTAIENAGLPVPTNPMQPIGQNPSITVMILPNENSEGMLEDVCLKSVEENPEYSCIDDFFICLSDKGISVPDYKSKAEILAYLASNPELAGQFRIGLLGVSAKMGFWDLESEVFEPLMNFLLMIVKD